MGFATSTEQTSSRRRPVAGIARTTEQTSARGRADVPTRSSVLDAFVRGDLGKRDLQRLAVQYDLGVSPERLVELGMRRRAQWLLGAVTGRDGT